MSYVPPRRVTSTTTTITVSAPATTALGIAASNTAAGSWTVFSGPTPITSQYGIGYEQTHPFTGVSVDPTEDGGSISSPSSSHPAVDWFGKGCYDSQTKRVTWASCGAGNLNYNGANCNTQPFYDETLNRWTVSRQWKPSNEALTDSGVGHGYDNNCISVTNRKLYKTRFSQSNDLIVFDLDANTWGPTITGPGGGNSPYYLEADERTAPMEYIPGRDELWRFTQRRNDYGLRLIRMNCLTGAWSTLIDTAGFGGLAQNTEGGCMSYNPRAFGGVGGALMGSIACFTVNAQTMAVTNVGLPNGQGMTVRDGAHLCRDPVGDGWFWVDPSTSALWRYRASTGWVSVSTLSGVNITNGFVMVPIDAHGVIWFVAGSGSTTRGQLYRPAA